MSRHPPITWAQSRDAVFVTVVVSDATDVNVAIEQAPGPSALRIALRDGAGTAFACSLVLFAPVDAAVSAQDVKPRGVHLRLAKATTGGETWFWPRLLASSAKNANVAIDWAQWKDEDDLAAAGAPALGAVGPASGNLLDDPALFPTGPQALASTDLGGVSLDSAEVQRTLAALRDEQLKLKRDEAAVARAVAVSGGGGSGLSAKERRRRLEELEVEEASAALLKAAPAFGFAKQQQQQQQPATTHDDDDGDDEPPPLV
jgi:hypothetical protein